MSIFPSTVEELTRWNNIFSGFYLAALIVGVISSAGIIYCANRLQSAANLKIADANRTAAIANQKAEQLERENLEIKRQMADRFITPTEQKAMVEALSPFRGHDIFVQLLPESEPKDYGNSLIAAFKQAEWVVHLRQALLSPASVTPRGLVLRLARQPDTGAEALKTALQTLDPSIKLDTADGQQESFAELQVGAKP